VYARKREKEEEKQTTKDGGELRKGFDQRKRRRQGAQWKGSNGSKCLSSKEGGKVTADARDYEHVEEGGGRRTS